MKNSSVRFSMNALLFSVCLLISCGKSSPYSGLVNSRNIKDSYNTAPKINAVHSLTAQPAGSVGQSAFSLWGTCSTYPYLISGSNGICVPVGGSGCGSNYLGAQQSSGQNATGMQFYGCFKGASNAPGGSNEMAVFLCTDITNWTGYEMGFVKTLSDNVLKAYIQGNGVYHTDPILYGDNGYHTFKCQVESNDHSKVDFYVDGSYATTLQNSGISYWGDWYYFVATTHRTTDGWSSAGQQIEMYDMTTY